MPGWWVETGPCWETQALGQGESPVWPHFRLKFSFEIRTLQADPGKSLLRGRCASAGACRVELCSLRQSYPEGISEMTVMTSCIYQQGGGWCRHGYTLLVLVFQLNFFLQF